MPTIKLRPSADQAKVLARYPALTRNYTAVDEATADDSDYVYYYNASAFVVDLYDTYQLPNLPANAYEVTSVTMRYRGQVAIPGTTKQFTGGVSNGVSQAWGTLRDTSLWTTYTKVWNTSPFTGIAWTVSEVNSLLACARTVTQGGAECRVSWFELEVVYTEVVNLSAAVLDATAELGASTVSVSLDLSAAVLDATAELGAATIVFSNDLVCPGTVEANDPSISTASVDASVSALGADVDVAATAVAFAPTVEEDGSVISVAEDGPYVATESSAGISVEEPC